MGSIKIKLKYDKLTNLITYIGFDELNICFLYIGSYVILCMDAFNIIFELLKSKFLIYLQ